jgi:hypothetical protein
MNRIATGLALALITLPIFVYAGTDVVSEGGVSYATGGAGTEERDALEARSGRFNLKLTHAAPTGEYVSDVKVRISDHQGKIVLDAVTDGPLFYAQLPPGGYTVICSLNGNEQKRSVQVTTGKQADLKFTWPVS